MADVTPWVRQYTLCELLDDGFDLFKEQATTLLLAGGLPFLVLIIYEAVMHIFVVPGNFSPRPSEYFATLRDHPDYLYYKIGEWVLSLLAVGVGFTAQCRIATQYALGLPVSLRSAFRAVIKPAAGQLVVMCHAVVFLVIGGVAGVIAGAMVGGIVSLLVTQFQMTGVAEAIVQSCCIILGLIGMSLVGPLFLSAPVSLSVDRIGPFSAMGKSFQIASSNFRAHCLSYLFMQIIPVVLFVPSFIVWQLQVSHTLHFSPMISQAIISLFSLLGNVVTMAVFAAYMSLVYFDGRCRREHLDLLVLARKLGMGDEIEQAFQYRPSKPVAPNFPNYAVVGHQQTSDAPSMAHFPVSPDASSFLYRSPPAPPGAPASVSATAGAITPYPDYSAPPPDIMANGETPARESVAPAPAVALTPYPDYSSPPPIIAATEHNPVEESPDAP